MKNFGIAVFLVFMGSVSSGNAQLASVGVKPYQHPELAPYRAFAGIGGNIGHLSDAPLSYVGGVSYQTGHSVFSVDFVSSINNSSEPPRNSMLEVDLLYGYALDFDLARYESSPLALHVSISAGFGSSSYSSRWRRGRGGVSLQDPSLPLNSTVYSASYPVQLLAMYEPFSFVGVGGMVFGSFSKRLTPTYGLSAILQVRY